MNIQRIFHLALLIFVTLMVAAYHPVHARESTLLVGITGSNSLEGLQNPVVVAQRPEVSMLLQAIADQPRSADFIEQELTGSVVDLALLVELGLVKPWDNGYAISFNYLTVEYQVLLKSRLTPFAESLAQAYREELTRIESLFAAYRVSSVDIVEVAYAIIGAMSLDWDCLDLTAEKGLRITADKLPGDREFIIWA